MPLNKETKPKQTKALSQLAMDWMAGKDILNECPIYDYKPSDGEFKVLELWRRDITPLL